MASESKRNRPPGAPEADFGAHDDEELATQNWRKMPMEAINRGSLAVVRGAFAACSVSGKEPGVMRLITIGFSPYCEKVRWALDLARVKYTEDAHAPGFHAFETLPATSGRCSATPVLVLRDGTATWDSTEILKRLAIMYSQQLGTLYPPGMGAEVEALEEYLDDVLGPNARQWQYYFTLRDEGFASSFFTKFNASVERWLMPFVYADLRKGLGRALKLSKRHRQASLKAVDEVFAAVAERLSDGRPYLMGESFTAADLTFAALAYPVLHPPQLQYLLPEFDELPSKMKKVIVDRRATVAGEFAFKIYRKHRFPPKSNMNKVILRSGKRDQVPWLVIMLVATFAMLVFV